MPLTPTWAVNGSHFVCKTGVKQLICDAFGGNMNQTINTSNSRDNSTAPLTAKQRQQAWASGCFLSPRRPFHPPNLHSYLFCCFLKGSLWPLAFHRERWTWLKEPVIHSRKLFKVHQEPRVVPPENIRPPPCDLMNPVTPPKASSTRKRSFPSRQVFFLLSACLEKVLSVYEFTENYVTTIINLFSSILTRLLSFLFCIL